MREALEKQRKLLGADHASTLATLGNMAVFLIGQDKFTAKLSFEVYHASKGALATVEKAGGSVKMTKPVEEPKKVYT